MFNSNDLSGLFSSITSGANSTDEASNKGQRGPVRSAIKAIDVVTIGTARNQVVPRRIRAGAPVNRVVDDDDDDFIAAYQRAREEPSSSGVEKVAESVSEEQRTSVDVITDDKNNSPFLEVPQLSKTTESEAEERRRRLKEKLLAKKNQSTSTVSFSNVDVGVLNGNVSEPTFEPPVSSAPVEEEETPEQRRARIRERQRQKQQESAQMPVENAPPPSIKSSEPLPVLETSSVPEPPAVPPLVKAKVMAPASQRVGRSIGPAPDVAEDTESSEESEEEFRPVFRTKEQRHTLIAAAAAVAREEEQRALLRESAVEHKAAMLESLRASDNSADSGTPETAGNRDEDRPDDRDPDPEQEPAAFAESVEKWKRRELDRIRKSLLPSIMKERTRWIKELLESLTDAERMEISEKRRQLDRIRLRNHSLLRVDAETSNESLHASQADDVTKAGSVVRRAGGNLREIKPEGLPGVVLHERAGLKGSYTNFKGLKSQDTTLSSGSDPFRGMHKEREKLGKLFNQSN